MNSYVPFVAYDWRIIPDAWARSYLMPGPGRHVFGDAYFCRFALHVFYSLHLK